MQGGYGLSNLIKIERILQQFSVATESGHILPPRITAHRLRTWVVSNGMEDSIFIETEADERARSNIVRGLEFSVEYNTIGDSEVKVAVLRTKTDNRFTFAPFLIDLLELELHDIDTDILETVEKWRAQWELSIGGLNDRQQLGLFGELLILDGQLRGGNTDVVEFWKGPLPADSLHDFKNENHHVEVKTTLQKPPVVRISNLDQLVPISGVELDLVVVEISVASENVGEKTFVLPDLVEIIRSKISDERIDLFEEKLRLACYFDSYAAWYRRIYRIDAIKYCNISEDTDVFPPDLAAQLPSSVVDVKYSLKTHLLEMREYTHQAFSI